MQVLASDNRPQGVDGLCDVRPFRIPIEQAMRLVAEQSPPKGRPAAVRHDQGVPNTGGGSNSGRDLPEARR